MAHPFFDAPAYPWHRPEAIYLHRALCAHATLGNPNTIVLLYQQSRAGLPALAVLGTRPADIWKEALDILTSAGALRKLCELIRGFPGGISVNIENAIRDVMNSRPAIEARILSDTVVVLDREHLREQLGVLEPDDTPMKVLIVRGPAGTGKSWGRFLFERAARDKGAQPVYLCDANVATVDEVIDELFTALDALDQKPSPHLTTGPAYYKNVCSVLRSLASSKHRPLWIAVDDLGVGKHGGPLLDENIRLFFIQFVQKMVNPSFYQWFRLMLIDYPESLPTTWPREILVDDRTSDADVKHEHVIDLLRGWLVNHDRKMIDDDLTKLADEVLVKAKALKERAAENKVDTPWLQAIHEAVAETLKSLSGRTD